MMFLLTFYGDDIDPIAISDSIEKLKERAQRDFEEYWDVDEHSLEWNECLGNVSNDVCSYIIDEIDMI